MVFMLLLTLHGLYSLIVCVIGALIIIWGNQWKMLREFFFFSQLVL